jgi:hypothetical protein
MANAKKALFYNIKLYLDGVYLASVTSSTFTQYWILYHLHAAAKKPKIRQFLDSFFEKYGTWTQEEIKSHVMGLVQSIAKAAKPQDVQEFMECHLMEQGKLSGSLILRAFKSQLEGRVDVRIYLNVGMTMGLEYIDGMKGMAKSLLLEYAKTHTEALTEEEFIALVNHKITNEKEKESWKIIAVIEYGFHRHLES